MANSFFDFDTSLKGDPLLKKDGILPDEDDCFENEEKYDALNDETFGACDSTDDWEQQHEQFAEINEITKQSKPDSSTTYACFQAAIDKCFTEDLLDEVTKFVAEIKPRKIQANHQQRAKKSIANGVPNHSRNICTVEELEKNLLKCSTQNNNPPQQNVRPHQIQDSRIPLLPMQSGPAYHHLLQHTNTRIPPPNLPPISMPPPGITHIRPHPLLGAALRMVPHMVPNGTPRPPGFMYPLPVNNHFGFPPPPHVLPNQGQCPNVMPPPRGMYPNNMQIQQQRPQYQHIRRDNSNYRPNHKEQEYQVRDEYAGLMTAKDKQWLLNIQMLQLNTGTPYFDDYYYTIHKERQLKNNKENNQLHNDRNGRFPNNSGRQRKNSERQDGNTLTPRVYTPLQFENSLGKLQCGSVTAPRKIIDMDIVTPEKDQDIAQPTKDSRKIKQLLLELEALYSLLLRAEDLKNPMFISNMEKWREMKQKQRLRELEQAPTPEQKQEVLRLFKLESEPVVESQHDYIMKIINCWLQEEKFVSFLNIRKGKMLLLRLLPHLNGEFANQQEEVWTRVLLSLPITGRRDTAGDNIFPKFYSYFKR
ncbi:hypothetical protein GWI33_020454 [Rhynchophorus ferrugineus]|uniref:Uncharacterized protein n=1 Tax=Rhynchophorus ferrugineus TaxID=354439 RepID=A0A834LZF2_RHYFE|nr:hypothetical protein GWI33_020454 [Rhynchophorus ferrugineus]